jgi:hypothetical protein
MLRTPQPRFSPDFPKKLYIINLQKRLHQNFDTFLVHDKARLEKDKTHQILHSKAFEKAFLKAFLLPVLI